MLNKRIYASEIRIHINDMVGSVKIHQLDEMHDLQKVLAQPIYDEVYESVDRVISSVELGESNI